MDNSCGFIKPLNVRSRLWSFGIPMSSMGWYYTIKEIGLDEMADRRERKKSCRFFHSH
jgi:hypothetical protein